MMLGGGAYLYNARANPPVVCTVTGEELAQVEKMEDMPGWIAVMPENTLHTSTMYVKMRSGQPVSKFVLVQAKDRWLIAHVDARYKGGRIEGQLKRLDHLALPRIQTAYPEQSKVLLPCQLEAEYDIASTQQSDTIMGAAIAGFGLLVLCIGLSFLFMKIPPPTNTGLAATPAQRGQGQTMLRSSVLFEGSSPQVIQLQEPPRARGVYLGGCAVVLWMVIIFVTGMALCIAWVYMATDNHEERKRLAYQAGAKVGVWLFLGSIVVPIVLRKFGWLPGARKQSLR
jgi:hypothetical protein